MIQEIKKKAVYVTAELNKMSSSKRDGIPG